MSLNKIINTLLSCIGVFLVIFSLSCSNQKNTSLTRLYHSVNTRYNIHFNAEEAYKEALKAKQQNSDENLSEMLYIFPDNSDTTDIQSGGGSFTTTIDKTTKAIKLHSIKTKPKRDPNRRNDAEYQAWLQQKEYTPFMDKVWLLLARAEFHDGNYLRAITTFMYITKIYSSNPDIVAECNLWIARAYTEMGWIYEAGNILHKMELAGGAPEKQKALYSAVKANYLIRTNELAGSVPFLEYAIKKEKDKYQKLRMKYLLGQLYTEIGDKKKANNAFSSVQGMNTPYKFTFNAKLQQSQLDTSKGKDGIVSSLNKMAKSSKNKDYLDQIYYSIGNIYINNSDTTRAIENYRKAIQESTRNGYDKTIAQVMLGDIYFNQREFVKAQPCYQDPLSVLKKSHPDYPRVALRSDVLDELVVHVKTVYEQDSLQHLASLPEGERLTIINQKIEQLKKEEEEKQKQAEREKQSAERENRIGSWGDLEKASLFEQNNPQKPAQTLPQNTSGQQQSTPTSFYFYNEQAVNQGKIAFQRQWGKRKLEDDWRRGSKTSFSSSLSNIENEADSIAGKQTDTVAKDNLSATTPDSQIVEDIYSVDYYLQQLPLTPEAVTQSNVLIENALFNMGKIYKNKLEDMYLAIDAFNTDIKRFPQTPNLEEIYYQLFLIYMQMGNTDMMANYRNKLLSEFPESQYATPLSDPDYEWNFRHMPILQDSLYNAAYNAYQNADTKVVRENYQTINTKYPFTDLMPKFALLNALSYAQTKDIKGLSDNLKELTTKYPKSDVTPLANEILDRIKDGKIILSDGSPITEFDWSKAYLSDNATADEEGKTLAFSDSIDTEYLLMLMFKSNTIDRNELLYEVADYNFSNYVIQTFDLNFDTEPPYDILQIKGFKSFSNIRSYLYKAFASGGLMTKIDTTIIAVPISVENYTKMLPRLGMEQYKIFFAEHHKEDLPSIVRHWNNDNVEVDAVEKTIVDTPKEEPTIVPDITETDRTQIKEKDASVSADNNKQKEVDEKPVKTDNDKQINADDLLTKDQLEKAGKVNDAIETVEDIISNPVDGIKNLFKKFNNSDNLTKEEKAAIKEEKAAEKQRQKELKAMERNRLDSIKKIEKAYNDSVAKAEKAIQDSIKSVENERKQQIKLDEQKKKDAEKATIKAKEDERKQKEDERRERQKANEERLRQLEQGRKTKERAREEERKVKEQEQKERLRQREKEREEKEKIREQERKEKEKQAKERRKARKS